MTHTNYPAVLSIIFLLMVTSAPTTVFADELAKEPEKPVEKLESAIAVSSVIQPVQRLGDVKKIFIDSLGNNSGSELIRQKVINRLSQSALLTVTNSCDDADAILTGTSQVSEEFGVCGNTNITNGTGNGFVSGGTSYSPDFAIRLLGKNRYLLWTDEYREPRRKMRILRRNRHSGRFSDVISRVADQIIQDLTEAIEKDKEASQISNIQHTE